MMKVSVKTVLRRVFVTSLIMLHAPFCEYGSRLTVSNNTIRAQETDYFVDKDITCVINLNNDMRSRNGLETGFSYELIKDFAEDNNCNVRIITGSGKQGFYLDSLKHNKVDIMVMHMDKVTDTTLHVSHTINDKIVWVVNSDNGKAVGSINYWLHYYIESGEYDRLHNRFFRSFEPLSRAKKGAVSNIISPYDDLIKKYAAELGWDWRMLAAVIYQESKFSINSTSHRGAKGLMQVMPETGRYYGITDLIDPENNLIAGTSHLKRVQRIFSKRITNKQELIKFTLAAYNAGEGRILDCYNLAAAKKFNCKSWDDIVNRTIPLMRNESILNEKSVKLGKFQGHETINYVNRVMDLYNAICRICPNG